MSPFPIPSPELEKPIPPRSLAAASAVSRVGVPLVFETFHKRIMTAARLGGKEEKLKQGMRLNALLQKIGMDRSRTLFKDIYNIIGTSIQVFIVGGAPMDPQIIRDFRVLGVNMFEGYGLTETSPIIAMNADYREKPGAAGAPLNGTEIRIDAPVPGSCFRGVKGGGPGLLFYLLFCRCAESFPFYFTITSRKQPVYFLYMWCAFMDSENSGCKSVLQLSFFRKFFRAWGPISKGRFVCPFWGLRCDLRAVCAAVDTLYLFGISFLKSPSIRPFQRLKWLPGVKVWPFGEEHKENLPPHRRRCW